MTFDPSAPQPTDIPAENQDTFLLNFETLNSVYGQDHIPFGNIIEQATSSNPIIITSPNHRLVTGNTIVPSHMQGKAVNAPIASWVTNGNTYTVTVIDENTFSIPVDSSNYPTYIPSSGDFNSANLLYGYHLQNTFPTPLQDPPNLTSPKSSYYTRAPDNIVRLLFQNGKSPSNEVLLTSFFSLLQDNKVQLLSPFSVETNTGRGMITPWGFILNFGQVKITSSGTVITFPKPFTSVAFSCILTGVRNGPFDITNNNLPAVTNLTIANFTGKNNSLIPDFPLIVNYFAIGI